MTEIQFSTSDPNEAVRRVRRVAPEASDELVEFVRAEVAAGHVRVGDPFMYSGQAPIYPTKDCDVDLFTAQITALMMRGGAAAWSPDEASVPDSLATGEWTQVTP